MPAAEEQPDGISTVLDRFTIYYILIPGMVFHSLILYAFDVITLQEMLTIKAVPFIAWSSVMSFVWVQPTLYPFAA